MLAARRPNGESRLRWMSRKRPVSSHTFEIRGFTATAGRLWLWQEMHLVLVKNPGRAGWRRSRASSTAARAGRGLETAAGNGAGPTVPLPPCATPGLSRSHRALTPRSSAVRPDSSRAPTAAPFSIKSRTMAGLASVAAAIISGVNPREPFALGSAPCSSSTRSARLRRAVPRATGQVRSAPAG